MLAESTEGKAFCVTKELIFPKPVALKPIAVLVLVHSKLVAFPEKSIAGEFDWAHSTWSGTGLIVGVGFTVMEKSSAGAIQVRPPKKLTGVTVITELIGLCVGLITLNDAIEPEPSAAVPMLGLLLLQLSSLAFPRIWMRLVASPLQ